MLKNIRNAIRNLPRHGQHNMAKILCLGFGLAVSSILIAEIFFEQSYDTFAPDSQRIYLVNENYIQNGELKSFPQTSGGIAQGIKRYAPQVEAATRLTWWYRDEPFVFADKWKIKGNMIFVDSCFFDMFPRKIYQGNAKDVLSRPLYCMISRTLAEKIGGDVVGKSFYTKSAPTTKMIIGGVFEDYPRNSTLYDMNILLSLSTMHGATYDGSEGWIGNDRYVSYIRLAKGHSTAEIDGHVKRMIQENLPLKEMKKAGVELTFTYTSLPAVHSSDPYVKKMALIMSILAFVLLFSTVMNYLLIVTGNLINRSQEMAIRKCYGANRKNIIGILFSEAFVNIIISLLLAALLIFVCKGAIEQFLSAPIGVLLFNSGSWILVAVCVVVLLVNGIVPGLLYSSVPVSSAFRGYKQRSGRWKMALLSIQFIASGLLISLLVVINAQYSFMVNDNPGYDYHNLATLNINGIESEQRAQCITELQRLPEVDKITAQSARLTNPQSGNNILLPGDDKEYMNIADLYGVSDKYLDVMGIKLISGRNFTEQTDSLREVMVSKKFVEKMKTLAHWNDAVGKNVIVTEHSQNGEAWTICGVYDEVRLGSMSDLDDRPSVMFYTKAPAKEIVIRFHQLTPEAMEAVSNKVKQMYPDNEFKLESYPTIITDLYSTQKSFRTGVLVAGLVILLISLTGLIGYTNDEVNRRKKEIAIRKVNGAQVKDILSIFARQISNVAIPSLIVGGIASYFISAKWMESFSERIPLNPLYFIISLAVIYLILLTIVVINCYHVANNNPVEYLKNE